MAWNVSFHKSTQSIHHTSLATFPNPWTLAVSQCFLLPFLVKIIISWTDQSFLLAPNILHGSLHFFPASWACYIKNISMQFRKIRSKTCIRLISWFPTIYFTGFIPKIYFAHFNPTALIERFSSEIMSDRSAQGGGFIPKPLWHCKPKCMPVVMARFLH